jgi:hypothetical protein
LVRAMFFFAPNKTCLVFLRGGGSIRVTKKPRLLLKDELWVLGGGWGAERWVNENN